MIVWSHPPNNLSLQSNHVDVWRVITNLQHYSLSAFETILSTDELQHASRFHFDKDRERYLVAHTSLRHILSRYLQAEPNWLNFSTNVYGKPFLPDYVIEFNLSHSGDYALIAIAHSRNVGVDVEQLRADIEIESLAGRYFSPREVSELMALPPQQRLIGFFNCWTRKEAYIKARGLGLSLPLDSFDVSLKPSRPAVLRATRPDAGAALQWTMLSLEVGAKYAGAVAVWGNDLDFRFWDWITPETYE